MSETKRTYWPMHFDGHGLNDPSCERILNFSRHPQRDGGDYILPFEERERIAKQIEGHAELLAALKVVTEALEDNTDCETGEESDCRHCRILSVANAAIARAEDS